MLTGLKLALPCGACAPRTARSAGHCGCKASTALCTVEKGNVPHSLHINATVRPRPVFRPKSCLARILLARWFREHRPPSSCYVFPSAAKPGNPVSTSYMWRLIRGVLARAGVSGSHAHPHTFRHTFVHMMTGLGVSADVVVRGVLFRRLRIRLFGAMTILILLVDDLLGSHAGSVSDRFTAARSHSDIR